MSRAQEQIDLMMKWSVRGIVAICSFLIAMLVAEIRGDIRELLHNQSGMEERLKAVERYLEKHEHR